jgi:hypothetical protein
VARKKYEWNQNKFEKFIKEGRGQGYCKDYKPWITTQEVPSIGRRSRIAGWKSGRLHHFLSDRESDYAYILDWADNVVDIREQFPLIDLEIAQTIASDMGVRYPSDRDSNFPYVLTTDFLITITVDGKNKDIARTIKYSKDLDRQPVIEKFEIERRYWTARGIDWGIVTENEIPRTLAANLQLYHPDYYLEPTEQIELPQMYWVANLLKEKLYSSKESVLNITTGLDKDMQIEIGTCLRIFRHLVARKEVILDITQKIDLNKSAQSLVTVIMDKRQKERIA